MNLVVPTSALPESRLFPATEPGALAATKWVACGLSGGSPDGADLIAAVHDGLVRLGDPWEVTERGRATLRRYGLL